MTNLAAGDTSVGSTPYKSDAPWNEMQWKNERFDQLLAQARAELDPSRKYEMNGSVAKIGLSR